MKKMMKKITAILAMLAMVVTMLPAMGVKAEETQPVKDFSLTKTGSITIHKTTQNAGTALKDAGFTLYKVITFKEDGGKYVVDTSAIAGISTGESVEKITQNRIKLPENAKAAEYTYKGVTKFGEIKTDGNGDAVFTGLTAGIYVAVESTVPGPVDGKTYFESAPFAISFPRTTDDGATWKYNITATPKNNEVGGNKDIVDVKNTGNGAEPKILAEGDAASANVGDTIRYRIKTTTPKKGTEKLEITDKLTNLDYANPLNLKVYFGADETGTLVPSTDYTLTGPANDSFTITFGKEWINANPAKEISIFYNVVVTEDAIIGTDANTNEVKLDFGKDTEPVILPDKPKVYTYGFELTKNGDDKTLDGDNETLNGVEFNLYKNEVKDGNKMNEAPLVTKDGGKITVKGLAAGTYYLEETKTAKGYTLLASPVKIVITEKQGANEATIKVDSEGAVTLTTTNSGTDALFGITIQNHKGFTLPETGGMGTYLFTIGGLVIMACAAAALAAMKKRA
ncbi:MAG: SpaH/EbpB family LPXTG-anchored major pilin [Eubacteriales bacterium]|nr:SpaH/EbpB family LPXTG-anchored major pilin [Eubacteriales bacterium]